MGCPDEKESAKENGRFWCCVGIEDEFPQTRSGNKRGNEPKYEVRQQLAIRQTNHEWRKLVGDVKKREEIRKTDSK